MSARHLLVVGAGSVGRRHLRNLHTAGADVSCVDPRSDRLDEAGREAPIRQRFHSLDAALTNGAHFDGVVICSPPVAHVEQALRCVGARMPLLIEKPLSTDVATARDLCNAVALHDTPVLLGYTYRWWPPLAELRSAIRAGEIGQPRHVRCVMSAHLADWHPWERYQDFFMAKAALGGGALLDESHFLDLMIWFFGLPKRVYARVEHLSSLEIDTDDNVDAILEYDEGLRILMHLDLYGRPHEKSIRIVGDSGTCEWTFEPNETRFSRHIDQTWRSRAYVCERNDMFVSVAAEFLAMLDTGATPSCGALDGLRVLEVIDAMRRSSQSRSCVVLDSTA
jgi:predicted dehydrogenase